MSKPIFAVYKPAFLGMVEEIDLPQILLKNIKGKPK